ncbi:heme oxygenase-like protein [Paucimonas lemoignei]|uniref:Heme oxygenase-like protein n=1 Tax=Paucimonas lemoignei TaxID=29443 RepID=A0A4R3I1I0_PAULE|nr:iron-containing redox enzyme family protein [Paucimonas lemoignei]TCS39392.1 heme oxygenase-like protein [Paucimonas lemoignei]
MNLTIDTTEAISSPRLHTISGNRQLGHAVVKALYNDLMQQNKLSGEDDATGLLQRSHLFLEEQLKRASALACDLPAAIELLPEWMEQNSAKVGQQYRSYLAFRKAGGSRQYFANKSHAQYFLNAVAPTKLVDGAWLYGLLQRWNDARFATLIRIYLEELGEGLPDKNHVVLYRKLLSSHGCERWNALDDAYFVQGAIQLALAHHAADFLPEVIGFNLGYEQLPLHLLITSYELDELGIDPYYFTLHVTVDNAATGHANKALQSVMNAMPQVADRRDFYRRMINGYKLNLLGIDTISAIRSFDLERELLTVLGSKAAVGAHLHSDYCRVGGRTVNDWLSAPGQLPAFLASLEQTGWIKRHQDPQNSRFWKLIQGERAAMFGVFNAYEQQLIHDWIGGDWITEKRAPEEGGPPRQLTFRAQQRLRGLLDQGRNAPPQGFPVRGVMRTHIRHQMPNDANDFNADLRELEQRLAASSSQEEMMTTLIELMSPETHHTAPGLMATRIFSRLFQA